MKKWRDVIGGITALVLFILAHGYVDRLELEYYASKQAEQSNTQTGDRDHEQRD